MPPATRPMLRVLDRYLLREVIHAWLAITLILWFVLISNRLVRYLASAAAGGCRACPKAGAVGVGVADGEAARSLSASRT